MASGCGGLAKTSVLKEIEKAGGCGGLAKTSILEKNLRNVWWVQQVSKTNVLQKIFKKASGCGWSSKTSLLK